MQLSPEDTLKLNVLLANAQAVRINEANMSVHGLTGADEASVKLNPTCREDQYLRLVREMLATHALGSPRGYPVYLRRWTRLGDMHNSKLQDLLMLGEEEAVIAAARAPAVTNELARCIWWALPRADIARYLLAKRRVAAGRMAPRLAEFLLEFLPFEAQTVNAIDTVRLVLQPGLISDVQRDELWRRGAGKTHYYVGFLHAAANELPDTAADHPDRATVAACLQHADNTFAAALLWLLSAGGQGFLATCDRVLEKPADQDVVVSLLEAMASGLGQIRWSEAGFASVEELESQVDNWLSTPDTATPMLADVLYSAPGLRPLLRAMIVLAYGGEPLVRPIFARTDAIGSVMRTKIAPVTALLRGAIATLLGERIVQPAR
jgi:hypothetical protein